MLSMSAELTRAKSATALKRETLERLMDTKFELQKKKAIAAESVTLLTANLEEMAEHFDKDSDLLQAIRRRDEVIKEAKKVQEVHKALMKVVERGERY